MNTIKVYMAYHQLKAFNKGETVNIKFQFIDQNDVELNLDLSKIIIIYQSTGILVRKKKFKDLFKKNIY